MQHNLEMVRGDTLLFHLTAEGFDQAATQVTMTCRRGDAAPIFQKTLGDGVTALTTETYRVRVAPADTADATPGLYDYDVEVQIGGDVYTPVYGKLRLIADATR